MSEKKIPKKISPDYLKDSIVELRFESQTPFEFLIFQIYSILSEDGFDYKNPSSQLYPTRPNEGPQVINLAALTPVFQNTLFTVKLTVSSIIFNCVDKYVGWDQYFSFISRIINKLHHNQLISSYTRLGLRFINVVKGHNIFDWLEEGMRVTVPAFKTHRTFLRTVTIQNEFFANLQIESGYFQDHQLDETESKIDIDVYHASQISAGIDSNILSLLDDAHSIEKKVFFNILRQDRIDQMNPEY